MRRPASVPAPALVVGSAVSVQSGAALATKLFRPVGPGGAVELRLLLSAVALLVTLRPSARGRGRQETRWLLTYAVVLAAMNTSFYLAIDRIPIGIAVTVELLGPLAVAVGGSRRWRDGVWIGLAAVGIALLSGGVGGHVDPVGIGLAAVAAVMWGAYILTAAQVGRLTPGQEGLAVALGVAAVLLAPYGIVDGGTALLHPGVLGRGAAVALLSSLVPYSLELVALRRLRPSTFGVMMSIEPAAAALSGLVFLGQRLHPAEWLAIGCVMVASAGAVGTAPARVEVSPA